MSDNHWCCAYAMDGGGNIFILDTYEPFLKVLRADVNPLYSYGYYLKRQIRVESAWARFLALLQSYVFGKKLGSTRQANWVQSLLESLWDFFAEVFIMPQPEPTPEAPTSPVEPPVVPPEAPPRSPVITKQEA